MTEIEFGVIIHGGAWNIPDKAVDDHLKGVRAACEKANDILQSGGSAIDAVEIAVSLMEDDPTFDAGKGSFLNKIGEVEMDAIIATEDYRIGSVAAVQNIRNPIQLARIVRDKTDHVLVVGKGANLLAQNHGFDMVNPDELLIGRELERYLEIQKLDNFEPKSAFDKENGMGTVGAVCIDKKGKIAVGVSTGGTPYKQSGRVGDSPLWGSGAYVEPIGGCAATGYGEGLIKILATRQVIDFIRTGLSPQQATEKTISLLGDKIQGLGGLITLSKNGLGFSFNTPRMAFAYKLNSNEMKYGIN